MIRATIFFAVILIGGAISIRLVVPSDDELGQPGMELKNVFGVGIMVLTAVAATVILMPELIAD